MDYDRHGFSLAASLKFVTDNYRAILGLFGLVVYAIVRVAHDAFYSFFGLTPEAVGLSELLILGRAALYFVVFASALCVLTGIWCSLFAIVIGAGRRAVCLRKRDRRSDRGCLLPPNLELRIFRSHEAIAILFLFAFVLPLAVDGLAPYFLSFFFYDGYRLAGPILSWELILCGCFYWAQCYASFNRSGDSGPRRMKWRLRLGACWAILLAPLVASVLMLNPKIRSPFPALPLRIRSLEQFQARFVHANAANKATLSVGFAVSLFAWASVLAVAIYVAWRRPRDKDRDAHNDQPVGGGRIPTFADCRRLNLGPRNRLYYGDTGW
jgi:hypothetical protein